MNHIIIFLLLAGIVSANDWQFGLHPLFQLEGSWKMNIRGGTRYEIWSKHSDSELRGISYRVRNGDSTLLERIRIVYDQNNISYIPIVEDQNNRQPVEFKMIFGENKKFIFENKLHDFPQRIIYSLITADSIIARVEGSQDGKESGIDFHFARIK
jgi:Domain of unknown function (DUF6265)